MNHSTHVSPAIQAQLTSKHLVSDAGLSVLTSFLNALDFRRLCEDRFSQFVPATDVDQLRAAPNLFGPVASDATLSQFMNRIKDRPRTLRPWVCHHDP